MADIEPSHEEVLAVTQDLMKLLGSRSSVVRKRSIKAALSLLGEDSIDEPIPTPKHNVQCESRSPVHEELATFFNRDDSLKPSDNVHLCAAYHYSKHGPSSFSLQELRTIASEAGVVLPDRIDMTLKAATRKGKNLYTVTEKDKYRPTAAGGMYFKEQFDVIPGRQPKPAQE
jgi:hypothetical protein